MMEAEDLEPLPPNTAGWGMFDTKEENWIGNDAGPLVYKTEYVAEYVARIAEAAMGLPAGRVRERRFEPDNMVKKCDVKLKMSAEEALDKLEKGEIL